ncbi:unnamed protein product [Ectocarpus fasciculatus]
MMLAINFWILTFHAVYLGASWAVFGPESELAKALYFMATFPEVIKNVAAFCLCAGTGQLFVFFIIKEFGSLVNVTVTVSRKFFSVLVSVYIYGHRLALRQWVGVFCVYGGLALSVWTRYRTGEKKKYSSSSSSSSSSEVELEPLTSPSSPTSRHPSGGRGWLVPGGGGAGRVAPPATAAAGLAAR